MNRRTFLKSTGAVAGVSAAHSLTAASQGISIVRDPDDPVASAPPVSWAVGELRTALDKQGTIARIYPRIDAAPAGDRCIVVAGGSRVSRRQMPRAAHV